MSRREIPFIVNDEGRDKGKEFIITEIPAWDADELAQDIFRAMKDCGFSDVPPEVIAMGCAGLATVGLSVLSAAPKEVSSTLRNRLMESVEIVVDNEGQRVIRKVDGPNDFEEVSTIRKIMDKIFEVNFGFLVIAGE